MENNDGWEKVGGGGGELFEFEKVNDTIQGVLVAKRLNVGPNNSMMYDIENDKHELKAIWGNTLLDNRFMQINVGEEVKITFLGKETSEKTGRSYKNFDVYHRVAPFKKAESINTSKIADEVDQSLSF